MRKIFAFMMAAMMAMSTAQAQVNFTLKPVPGQPNQVRVYAQFVTTYTGKIQQFEIVVGYKNSDITGGVTAPTNITYTIDPALNSMFGVPYGNIVISPSGSTDGAYTYTDFSPNLGIGSTDATITAGTELALGTVSFSGGSGSVPVYLMDFNNGGLDGAGNTYISTTNPATTYTPTSGNSTFYSATDGSSTATITGTIGGGNLNSFVVTNAPIILPVKLNTFTAAASGNDALLSWVTATETNNRGFGIERSTDGIRYTPVTFIPTKAVHGNSSSVIRYSYTDVQPGTGICYYRLKQMDMDDQFSYSEVHQVVFDRTGNSISIFPNPASNKINIVVAEGAPVKQIRMSDMSGRQVFSSTTVTSSVDMQQLPAGNYLLQVELLNGSASAFKVTKQ